MTVLAPVRRRLVRNESVDNSSDSMDGGLDAPVSDGSDSSPGSPPPHTQTSQDQGGTRESSGFTRSTRRQIAPPTDTNASGASENGATGITQLPDGAGGQVAVPPPAINPSLIPPGPPWDTTPVTPPVTRTAETTDPLTSSTFDGDNNMLGSTVLPTSSRRLIGLHGAQDAALSKITTGPDRLALAKANIAATDSDYQRTLQDATNQAASHGYLGSGRLTNAYGDAADRRTQQIDKMLTDASAGTIQDNLNNLSATNSLEGNTAGEEAGARNELRGERQYQSDQSQLAITRRIQQAAAEQGMSQQDFDNAMRVYGAGEANNPEGAYETAAGNASAEAGGNNATMAQLLRLIAQRNNPYTPTATG